MALSPDGRLLAVAGNMKATSAGQYIRLHNFLSGEVEAILSGHRNIILDVAFSSDGKRLISGGVDRSAIIWSLSNPQKPKFLSRLKGHSDRVTSVAFSRDGRNVITASHDRTVRIWNVRNGRMRAVLEGHSAPCARRLSSGLQVPVFSSHRDFVLVAK